MAAVGGAESPISTGSARAVRQGPSRDSGAVVVGLYWLHPTEVFARAYELHRLSTGRASSMTTAWTWMR